MSENLQTALINLFGVLYVATLPVLIGLLTSTRKHAKTSAEQTKNSHPENMRDDIDLLIVAVHSIQRQHDIEDTLVSARAEKVRQKNRRAL